MTVAADLSRDALLQRLRGLELALRAKGVTGLAIFGSRARGDARPDSDLDVLVEVADDIKFSLLDLIKIEHIIKNATGIETQATMRRSIEPRFAARIADDTIEVF
ncbi:nucleotidyltransferase domain-containing protein [Microbacteriaceae bacterium K1510]|nr:nucleotidyltransferase domain-containing protein [Microbacteriaceae bacterium K1510]